MKTLITLCILLALISCDSAVESNTTATTIDQTETLSRKRSTVYIYGSSSFGCGRTKTYTHSSISNITSRVWTLKNPYGKVVKTSSSSSLSYYFSANTHGTYRLELSILSYHPKLGEIAYSGTKYIKVNNDPSKHY